MKKGILKGVMFLLAAVIIGCAHYSTADRSDAENMIHAPVDVVWGKTLEILRNEKVNLELVKWSDLAIRGTIPGNLLLDGSDLSVQLIPKGEKKTVAHIEAKGKTQIVGWGIQRYEAERIFNRIKEFSEESSIKK